MIVCVYSAEGATRSLALLVTGGFFCCLPLRQVIVYFYSPSVSTSYPGVSPLDGVARRSLPLTPPEVLIALINARSLPPTTHPSMPQDGELEESGGKEWEGKEGWELSEDRVEKLTGRLAKLRVLKFERATEMVELVVDCQKLFRQLGLTETNPLHTKVQTSKASLLYRNPTPAIASDTVILSTPHFIPIVGLGKERRTLIALW